jgi:hypothetical protein
LATASAFVRSVGCARRSISIWPIAGSVAWSSSADVPDHSTFSKNRHGRFRESDLLRKLFQTVVARCMKDGIVGGEAFAVDASIIVADAHRRRGVAKVEDLDPTSSRAVAEYLSVLDDAAFGGATPVEPKAISPTDPAARYTAAADKPAVYAYSDNYLSISSMR